MFVTGFDKTKNLLQVVFSGRVTADEAEKSTEQFVLLFTETAPGFRLLTDLSGLEFMESGCIPFISKSMDLCNQHGVGTVVRVIPDPHKDIGFNILSLFHYRHNLHIVTCATLEEAMNVLAG